jgi:dihydrofolate reductase
MGDSLRKPFDLLLGRKTYQIFAAHRPHVKNDPIAYALNGATEYVASKSLIQTLLKHDLIDEIPALDLSAAAW